MSSTILIVDDDPAILAGVATLLEQASYTTYRAASGEAAQQLLGTIEPPDLVVLDVMLPGIDGYAVCRHVRQLPTYVPILMLSARDEVHDRVLGLDLGADEYLTKPFAPPELLARVRAMLRFAEQRVESRPLVCGELQLLPDEHQVTLAGQALDLTATEWALLETLMAQPGRVWGRETLLQQVWEADYLGDSRVVDMCVQRLRSKLAAVDPDTTYIETVRGFGYRLRAQPC